MRRKLHKYLSVSLISIQNHLAYRGSFLGELFFYILIVFLIARLWSTVYAHHPGFMGFTRGQLVWYVTLTEFIGLSSPRVFYTFAQEIKAGSISYLLLRPCHYILYRLGDTLGALAVKAFFNLSIGLLLALSLAGPLAGFSPRYLPWLIPIFINSFLLDFFLQTSLGLSAFWLEENLAFYWIYSKLGLILGILLPQDLLPAWLQPFLRLLPWRYLHYGPARLTIGFSASFCREILTGQLCFLALGAGLSFFLFARGTRKVVHNGG